MAPPGLADVSCPVHGVAAERVAHTIGALLALAALVLWARVRPDAPAPWIAAAAASAAWAAWNVWRIRHAPVGELHWHAATLSRREVALTWSWRSAARPRGVALPAVRVVLDLGDALLLRGETPDGQRLWLCCRRDTVGDDATWRALRRAIRITTAASDRSGIFARQPPAP